MSTMQAVPNPVKGAEETAASNHNAIGYGWNRAPSVKASAAAAVTT